MKPVLTAVEMGQLDKFTIESHGLDGKILMSNAARSVLDQIRQRWPNVRRPVIFAGTGNNGGDGLALAYYAQQAGMNPLLLLCHPQITDPPTLSMDATYFYRIAQRAYVSMDFLTKPVLIPEILGNHNCDLIVDSIFGTGLAGQLDNYYVNIIDRMNISSAPILAIDCPSGLDSTTGEVISRSVQADLTVTMGYAKRGFYHPGAVRYVGELQVADLGFASISEAGIAPASHAWQEALWEPLRTWRSADTHKGDYGRLLIVAGSRKYPGAPRLAANAALDLDAARQAAAAQPDDFAAQLALAQALAGQSAYEEALETCLELVVRDRHGAGEEARKLMIDVFRVLPDDSELTGAYRRKLSAALY